MGTLASKVGENIVGKRLGMSEKDRKLLGTVFGMAGGAYGGYAGQAGFGSTAGSAFTAPGGQSAGMAGASPKVGGDYGTAMNLFSQPTVPGAGPGYYGSGPVGNVNNTGYQYIPAMGTEYTPIDGYSGVTGSADAPPTFEYDAMAGMDPGMDMYANPNYGLGAGPGYYGQQPVGQTGFNNVDLMGGQGYSNQYNQMAGMDPQTYGMDGYRINQYNQMAGMPVKTYGMDGYRITPVYQGPAGPATSAQTFALDTPSRTIGLAPSGTPLEVMDVAPYEGIPEPRNFLTPGPDGQMYPKDSFTKNNLSMGDAYDLGGNPDIELTYSTGGGYSIDPEGINMDLVRADSKLGGRLTIDSDRLMAANSRMPEDIVSRIENGPIIDNSLNAAPRSLYENAIRSEALKAPRDSVGRPILSDGIKAQAAYDAPVPLSDPQGTTSGLRAEADAIKFQAEYGNTPEQIQATAQEKVNDARQKLIEGGKRGDNRVIEREQQNIASTIDEVRATMQQQLAEDPSKLSEFLKKIPDSVKQWAAETGVALLDMWIKQSLFGQDYDDQIAEGGGGGGGVLRGSSPVVSPYSGGGSGGGGKGVLFSMGGSGQQGRGTHIMALQ